MKSFTAKYLVVRGLTSQGVRMSGKNVLITAVIALGVVVGYQYYQAKRGA